MEKKAIGLMMVLLVIGILIGYFLIPMIFQYLPKTTGGNIFGSSGGTQPPTMPP